MLLHINIMKHNQDFQHARRRRTTLLPTHTIIDKPRAS